MIRPVVLVLTALAGCGSYDNIRTTPQALSPTGSGEVRSFRQGPDVAVQAAQVSAASGQAEADGGNEYNRNADIYRGAFAGALAVSTAR